MKQYFLYFILISFLFSSEIINNTEKKILELFPESLSIDWSLYQISPDLLNKIQNESKQKFFRKELNSWKIIDNDSTRFYAFLDNVIGKTMPITFLVIFNKQGLLHNASIIKYREPYGGEVRSKAWLNQFYAYSDTSNYKIGQNISAISGATLSVNSVSKGIRKLSILIKSILEQSNEK